MYLWQHNVMTCTYARTVVSRATPVQGLARKTSVEDQRS